MQDHVKIFNCHLIKLNFNHNRIEKLPNSIKGLKNLKIFSLWGNT
ncbi:MAG TPA: hypothetical protein ENH75_11210 [archaeon]|nr:hypothetical protein [archaeon]